MGKGKRGTVPYRERTMKVPRAACMSEAFARVLVCHGTPKLPPCKCEQEKKAAQRWKDRVDALRGCYNWTDFVEDCEGFSSSSVMLCEGRTGPGDVCTEDSWRAYQLEQKYGRMEEVS